MRHKAAKTPVLTPSSVSEAVNGTAIEPWAFEIHMEIKHRMRPSGADGSSYRILGGMRGLGDAVGIPRNLHHLLTRLFVVVREGNRRNTVVAPNVRVD